MADDETLDFMPTLKNLAYYRGDGATFGVRFAGDVTARTFAAQVKEHVTDAEPIVALGIDAEYDSDTEKTTVFVSITGTQSAALPDLAMWDFQYIDDGEPITLLAGWVRTSGEVTT